MQVNKTAAALKLLISVQQSVSDCYSAKVVLSCDPSSSFHCFTFQFTFGIPEYGGNSSSQPEEAHCISNTVSSLSCEPVTKLLLSRGVEEQLAESVVACEIAKYLVALLGRFCCIVSENIKRNA
jgi:hypothetical protein